MDLPRISANKRWFPLSECRTRDLVMAASILLSKSLHGAGSSSSFTLHGGTSEFSAVDERTSAWTAQGHVKRERRRTATWTHMDL